MKTAGVLRSFTLTFLTIITALLFLMRASPARAVDEAEYFCNGSSGTTCDLFQLDGADTTTANADTCVGMTIAGKYSCINSAVAEEEDPIWPADWDALLYPSLTSASPAITPVTGKPPGAWTFALPWAGFGSFSGVFPSSLVSTGTSEILKQGSKNGNDISTWVVAAQASPPKDAYLAAALATYTGPPKTPYAGDEVVYFGSTRLRRMALQL
jgi:hypothetical protein